jgi:exonuclease III
MAEALRRDPHSVIVLSLNVGGLASAAKTAQLIEFARLERADVALIQETHARGDPLARWGGGGRAGGQGHWPGRAYYSGGTAKSRGCLTLARTDPGGLLRALPDGPQMETEGRVVRVDLVVAGTTIAFINVYAPASRGKRAEFFSGPLCKAIPTDPAIEVVLGGDWNCLEEAADQAGGEAAEGRVSSSRRAGADELRAALAGRGLVDAWRAGHPGEAGAFTRWDKPSCTGARLDRFYVSPALLQDWGARCEILPLGLPTDHHPVRLTLQPPGQLPQGKGWRPHFPLWLLDDSTYKERLARQVGRILGAPAQPGPTQSMDRWLAVKTAAVSLAYERQQEKARGERAAVRAAARATGRAMRSLGTAPGDVTAEAYTTARGAGTNTLVANLLQPALRARGALHQLYGDSSTYYFFSLPRASHPPTVIPALRPSPEEPAVRLDSSEAVDTALEWAVQHFSGDAPGGLFRARHGPDTAAAQRTLLAAVPRRLTPWEQADCEGYGRNTLVRKEELQVALGQCNRGTGAGLDGLPYEFYAAFWELVASPLVAALNEAWDSGSDDAMAALLIGVIILILKPGRVADLLGSYRPITLLNTDLRIWAKALSNRLQVPLDELIDPCQTAFLAGRDIADSVYYHKALMAWLQQRHEPLWHVLTDLANAYDSVSWDWLAACMRRLGFREEGHVRWAQLLHRGATSLVVVNGFLSRSFPLRGGLLQGSGLSPLLWTIVLQPLTAYVNSLHSLKHLALPDGSTAPPMHAYADDCNVACTGEGRQDAQPLAVRDALVQLMQPASGVGPQVPKCSVQCQVDGEDEGPGSYRHSFQAAQRLAQPGEPVRHQATGFKMVPPGEVGRLLGAPLTASSDAACQAAFAHQPGAMRAAAAPWRLLGLNQPARALVAKQCLGSKLVYQMGFTRPTKRQLAACQQTVRLFVAAPSGPAEVSPNAAQLWPREAVLALPKGEGGMGYPVLRHASTALLAKFVARAFCPGRQPWKALARGLLGGTEGAHGTAAWPVTLPAAGPQGLARAKALCAGLPALVRPHVEAAVGLAPTRVVGPEAQPFHSVMAEPLFHNSMVQVGDRCLEPGDLLAAAGQGEGGRRVGAWRCLGDVRRDLLDVRAPLEVTGAAAVVLGAVPVPWQAHLQALEAPAPEWECVSAPGPTGSATTYVRRSQAPAPSTPHSWAEVLYRQLPTGRLALVAPAWAMDNVTDEVGGAARREIERLMARLSAPDVAWQPAAVFARPKPRRRWMIREYVAMDYFDGAEAQLEAAALDASRGPQEFWLLGPWAAQPLDPSVWGLGGRPLLDYEVKAATAMGVQRAAAVALGDRYQPGKGVWPAVWPRPAGPEGAASPGLAGLEAGWLAAFQRRPETEAEAQRASRAGPAQPRPREEEWQAAQSRFIADTTPWLRPRAGPRPHVQDVVAGRASRVRLVEAPPAPGAQPARRCRPVPVGAPPALPAPPAGAQQPQPQQPHAGQQQPAPAGAHGGRAEGPAAQGAPAGAPPGPQPDWAAVRRAWGRQGDRAVRREDALVCYRAMHGVLGVNAFQLAVRTNWPRSRGCCPAPECSQAERLETLSHAFLECPAAALVVQWALDLWAALTPGHPQPPRCSLQQLLLGDNWAAGWAPQRAHAPIWGRLRAALLGALWDARCQLALGPTSDSIALRAHGAAAAVLGRLSEAANLGFLRATADVRTLSPAYPSQWFRGRAFGMEMQAFLKEWSMEGRFCDVVAGQLQLRVTHLLPVPLPGLGEHLAEEARRMNRAQQRQQRRQQRQQRQRGQPDMRAPLGLPAPPRDAAFAAGL